MISFLIPIYNRDVRKMVNAIYDQCIALGIEFEMLCYDDLSKSKYREMNAELGSKFGISYMNLSKNLGRSRIRNWLGKNARYNHLVFLDCDQHITRKSFVKKYVEAIGSADLVYGGTTYKKAKAGKTVRLHWKYGSKVEAQSVKTRMQHPYRNFRSNNFMILKKVFLAHPFDESIQGYGYEDTVIGHEMKLEGRTILHIDNPVEHAGLEKTEKFLQKNKEATENLYRLYKDEGIRTRMTDQYEKMKAWGLIPIFKIGDKVLGSFLDKKLRSENPWLFAFQWFKFRTFLTLVDSDNSIK